MLAEERRQKILELIYRDRQVSNTELCRLFDVSDETIRRDLAEVAASHPVKKVHGGAVLVAGQRFREQPYERRRTQNADQKRRIGIAAAKHIENNDMIALDTGTGAEAIAEAIYGVTNVRIVTAALPVAEILLRKLSCGDFTGKVYFIGGELHPKSANVTGGPAVEALRKYRVDKVFVGATAISESGISVWEEEDGVFSSALTECAPQVIAYAESEKLDKESFYRVCSLDALSRLITDGDTPMSKHLRAALNNAGVRVEFAAKHG